VIVTGGAGFIGSNLCRVLATFDTVDSVVALDDLSTGARANLDDTDDKIELVEGSILDADLVSSVVSGADAVVHLAARPSVPRSIENPMATHRVNVDGTMNLLEAARAQPRPPHIVFSSSSSVYGANPTLPKHEELATLPRSPYAASKLTAEAYVLAYQETFGVPALAFRFFNVFGPRQMPGHAYAAVVPAFLHAALQGEPLPVHGDGTQTRDFTFVGTVADVISRAVTGRVTSPVPVNLAFGTRSSLLEVIGLMESLLGGPLARSFLPTRAGDVRDSQAANERLRELFPNVVPVALHDGLTATLEWMRTAVAV
jgi:UDP-glucose 4-epimerase